MSDEVAHRNILAIKKHSEESRIMVRNMESLTVKLKQRLDMLEADNRALRQQVQVMQIKMYSGGATA